MALDGECFLKQSIFNRKDYVHITMYAGFQFGLIFTLY